MKKFLKIISSLSLGVVAASSTALMCSSCSSSDFDIYATLKIKEMKIFNQQDVAEIWDFHSDNSKKSIELKRNTLYYFYYKMDCSNMNLTPEEIQAKMESYYTRQSMAVVNYYKNGLVLEDSASRMLYSQCRVPVISAEATHNAMIYNKDAQELEMWMLFQTEWMLKLPEWEPSRLKKVRCEIVTNNIYWCNFQLDDLFIGIDYAGGIGDNLTPNYSFEFKWS